MLSKSMDDKRYNDKDLEIVVSVIIPTYNRSNDLVKAIKSVLDQTEQSLEILVCDDGSTDNTKEKVLELSNIDTRVCYLNCGHNGRPAIPRNIGIRNAKGEWLAFLDDDDIWFPEKIEYELEKLKEMDLLACCTNAYIIEDENVTDKLYFSKSKNKVYSYKDIIYVNPVICSSMIIHKSLISNCKGFPEEKELRAIEDYALWHRVCGYTDIYYLDLPLVGYTMCNSTSIRLKKQVSFKQQKSLIMKDFMEWLTKQPQSVKQYYSNEKLMGIFQYINRRIKRRLR